LLFLRSRHKGQPRFDVRYVPSGRNVTIAIFLSSAEHWILLRAGRHQSQHYLWMPAVSARGLGYPLVCNIHKAMCESFCIEQVFVRQHGRPTEQKRMSVAAGKICKRAGSMANWYSNYSKFETHGAVCMQHIFEAPVASHHCAKASICQHCLNIACIHFHFAFPGFV
jgi:hypothetical protein